METFKIELDDIDIGVLAFLSDAPNSTTTDIAKALFKPPYNIRKLDSFIRYRVKRLMENEVVMENKMSRRKVYSIDAEKVLFGDGSLTINGVGQVGIGYFIVVKSRGETIAKSLDEYENRLKAKKIFYEQDI